MISSEQLNLLKARTGDVGKEFNGTEVRGFLKKYYLLIPNSYLLIYELLKIAKLTKIFLNCCNHIYRILSFDSFSPVIFNHQNLALHHKNILMKILAPA